MRYRSLIVMVGLLALALWSAEVPSFGQRGGRGGGRGGGFRGGYGGGYRGGYVVGPYGGAGAGYRAQGTVVGPAGGSVSAGAKGGSYTTAGGTTITAGAAGKTATGPAGGTAGRAVGAVQVTTPGGTTVTKAGTAGAVAGPGGNAAATRSGVGVATGPGGSVAGASRGGVAIGPGGAVAGGSRVGVAAGPGGAIAGARRGGVAVAPHGLARYTAYGAAVGHRTQFISAGTLQARAVYVRQGFVHYHCFTKGWYTDHPAAWRAVAWTAATFWAGATWATVSSTCGYPAQPIAYDYGSSVVYEDGQVYSGGELVATAEEYTEQATQIAAKGEAVKVSEKEEWISLGVFGMVQGDEQNASDVFQLAVNKDGVLRGNYYSVVTDMNLPVYGSVDAKTRRAAWTVGEQKGTVYETGIGNLTESRTTMLVHFGKDRTQQWTLVRLEPPEKGK